jgi:hypothetical protein
MNNYMMQISRRDRDNEFVGGEEMRNDKTRLTG